MALYELARAATRWGLWTIMLGWLLGSAARSAIVQTAFTDQLEGITVADLMDAEPVTIPADLPAAQAYEDFFLRYQGWEWFAVVEPDGRFVGLAHREPLRQVAEGGAGADPSASWSSPPARTGRSAPTRRSRRCSAPSRCGGWAR